MTNEINAKAYCCEDLSLIENYEAAMNDTTQMYDCHHRWETDRGLSREELIFCCEYYYVPADRLIFLTKVEHRRLHHLGKQLSTTTREKISKANRGENHPNFGKHCSPETREKMREARLGKQLSEATKEKIGEKTREAMKGLKFWNNGKVSVRARSCPEGFVPGRLKKKKSRRINLRDFLFFSL